MHLSCHLGVYIRVGVELPDVANKNTGCPVVVLFQVPNNFLAYVRPVQYLGTHSVKKKKKNNIHALPEIQI